jgi:hypothetical protein
VGVRSRDMASELAGFISTFVSSTTALEGVVSSMIHLPGHRGNPSRNYPASPARLRFPGTFESYTAGVILRWQNDRLQPKLDMLSRHLAELSLATSVSADWIDDTSIELNVTVAPAAPTRGIPRTLSIADVGFGVSQSLPVLVAITEARSGQVVFIEQPEIHLHPRAQHGLASVLAEAASRGVRVVVETHSELLLLGVQTAIANGIIDAGLVRLHWFERGPDGATKVHTARLDGSGAFGDWPADFDGVHMQAQQRFLDASEPKRN